MGNYMTVKKIPKENEQCIWMIPDYAEVVLSELKEKLNQSRQNIRIPGTWMIKLHWVKSQEVLKLSG